MGDEENKGMMEGMEKEKGAFGAFGPKEESDGEY